MAGGVAHAKILRLGQPSLDVSQRALTEEEVGPELQRFQQALVETRRQILKCSGG